MGRIKTKLIKRITFDLVDKHFKEFTKDYEENKVKIQALTDTSSKKLRNVIAGYVTRLVKKGYNPQIKAFE